MMREQPILEYEYGLMHVRQFRTKGGNVRMVVFCPALPPCKTELHRRFYRKNVLFKEDFPKWTQTKVGRRTMTYLIGMLLVRDFRKSIEGGQITKEQASEIKQACNDLHGKAGTYLDREWQDCAARRLFDLTGDTCHFMTDAWL